MCKTSIDKGRTISLVLWVRSSMKPLLTMASLYQTSNWLITCQQRCWLVQLHHRLKLFPLLRPSGRRMPSLMQPYQNSLHWDPWSRCDGNKWNLEPDKRKYKNFNIQNHFCCYCFKISAPLFLWLYEYGFTSVTCISINLMLVYMFECWVN